MKIIRAALLYVLLPVYSFAQTADSNRNAIGIVAEGNSAYSGNGKAVSTFGVEYSRWNKKHLGYKITLGYGNYNYTASPEYRGIIADTLTEKRIKTNIDMAVIGFGVQAKRQFYRKLYFTCGLEIRAGYGSGNVDTTITKEYNERYINPVNSMVAYRFTTSSYGVTGLTANMLYVGFTPYFGLKLEFKKFAIGTEFMNYIAFTSLHARNQGATGSVDFDSGNITQRFFVQYKF